MEHPWLLEAAFVAFARDGEWPQIDNVQRSLADQPERAVAVSQLMIDMPPILGGRRGQHVALTILGVSFCLDAAPLLQMFVGVMLEALTKYPGDGLGQPVLHGSEVKTSLKLSEPNYLRISTLLLAEGWFFGGGSGDPDGDWTREIRAEILLLKPVTDIAGYLNAVATYRFGPPHIDVPQFDEEPSPSLLSGPRRWLAKRDPSAYDLLAVTVIGGLIVGVALWLLIG